MAFQESTKFKVINIGELWIAVSAGTHKSKARTLTTVCMFWDSHIFLCGSAEKKHVRSMSACECLSVNRIEVVLE